MTNESHLPLVKGNTGADQGSGGALRHSHSLVVDGADEVEICPKAWRGHMVNACPSEAQAATQIGLKAL